MSEKLIKRKLADEIQKFVKRREIIAIRGARQTGKTTLLKIIEKRTREDKAFINLDLIDYRRALEENTLDLVKRFKKPGRRLFLFLDEVQRIWDIGEKLKIIYDEYPDVKMFISGSSSLELKTRALPPLVGRLFLFELYTLDFEEFLSTKDEGLTRLHREKHTTIKDFIENDDEIAPPSFENEFLKHWREYVIYGGYPEVAKSKDREEKAVILKNIFNLYLEKDITSFFKIDDTNRFQDLLKHLAFNVPNLISISSLASDIKADYRKVEEFLTILQHTYVIYPLRPFHRNLTTELKKSPKIYFLDHGLRNSAIENFTPFENRTDKGPLMENFMLKELVSNFKEWKLNYWRTTGKAEVDFVLSKGDTIVPIEVKLGERKLGKSFYSFLNTYKPEKALVVSLDRYKKQKVGKTTVYWVPVFYF